MLDAPAPATDPVSELQNWIAQVETERDEYKQLYVRMLEAYRKLEAGLFGQRTRSCSTGCDDAWAMASSPPTSKTSPDGLLRPERFHPPLPQAYSWTVRFDPNFDLRARGSPPSRYADLLPSHPAHSRVG